MTTEELITKLKGLGVDDVQAEGFRDMRLKTAHLGGTFRVPAFTPDGKFFQVTAYFTGEDEGYVPNWSSVTEVGIK
jgi:butyrate kinase